MQSCSRLSPVPCYGKYYVYSSSPTVSHSDRSRRKPKPPAQMKSDICSHNHAANIRTRGAHEFYNMMWDPSIYRGNTIKPFSQPEMERCNKKRKDFDASVKRRKFPRKQKLVGGIERPKLSLADQEEKIGLGDMGMQTEEFLAEMTSDVAKKDMCTQVEAEANARKEERGCVLRPFMIGVSQDCQTDPQVTFPFEHNVRPIQKQMGQKIMEQCLLETTEELELEALRIEKRKYIETRSEEMYRLKREVEAQRIVAEERARAVAARQQEAVVEKEAESRLGAALFSAGCMGGMLPITFGVLKLEGYMPGSGATELYENLLPWMDEAVRKSYGQGHLMSRKLLDDMLQNVTNEREAEIASNKYWNPPSVSQRPPSQTLVLSEDELQDNFSLPFAERSKSRGKSMIFHMDYGEE